MPTMHAVRAHARGGPERLTYEEAPRPEPRAGEALIRIHAAGITPTELGWDETWMDRAGHPRVPTIPSHEVAGVVDAVGHGVVHVAVGDAVYGLIEFDHDGAAAEYVAILRRGGVLVTLAAPPAAEPAREHGVRAVFFIVEPDRAQLLELARLVDARRFRAEVACVFPLSRAREAYEFGLTSQVDGQVVNAPSGRR